MIMTGPGIPRGHTVRTAVTNPDVATTIAAIAHARPTRPQDGVDILPWLRRGYRDRVIPIEAYPVRGGRHPLYTGIREGPWTYVRYHWQGRNWEEMYNRAADPYELHNLALRPAFRAELERFRRLDARYRHCAGSTCPKQFTSPAKLPLLYGPRRP
jgi:arylsulfatase A-like enzyme